MRCLAIVAASLLFSCSGKRQEYLPPAKMEVVYWDIIQADVLARQNVMKDSTLSGPAEAARLRKDVLKVHEISKEELEASFDYYAAHPAKMRTVLDSIIAKQQRKRKKPIITETDLL